MKSCKTCQFLPKVATNFVSIHWKWCSFPGQLVKKRRWKSRWSHLLNRRLAEENHGKNTWDHDLPWKKHDDLQIERTHGLDVSENSRFSPNHPYFHGVFNYFYHPFWGPTPILGNPHMVHHIWSVSIGYFSQFQDWDLWVFSCFGNMTSWKIHHLKMYFLLKVGDFPMSC